MRYETVETVMEYTYKVGIAILCISLLTLFVIIGIKITGDISL